MPIGKLMSKLLGRGSRIELKDYECSECGETFESARQPKRASCPECLSTEVAPLGSRDS